MKKLLQLLLIISFGVFLVTLTVFPLEDSDIWFHLKGGEWIWQNKKLPCPDPFSWSVTDLCWDNPEWGVDLLIHGVESLGGLDGVIVAKAALITITFLLLLIFQIHLSGFSLWGLTILTIGVIASADRFMERVEHITYFLLVLFLALLFWWQKILVVYPKGKNFIKHYRVKLYLPLFLIPLLFLIWGNVHPSTALGMVLLVFFIAGESVMPIIQTIRKLLPQFLRDSYLTKRFIDTPLKWVSMLLNQSTLPSGVWFFLGAGAVLTLTAIINPYGLRPILGVFEVVRGGQNVYAESLIEWQSPFAIAHREQIYTQAFLLTLVLYWLTMLVGWFKNGIRLGPALILAGVSLLGLTRVRHINVFVLVGYLPVMLSLSPAGLTREYTLIKTRISANERMNRQKSVLSAASAYLVVLFFAGVIFFVSSIYIIKNGYQLGRVHRTFSLGQRSIFADKALAFLDEHNVNGNLFNGYGLGGYVIYAGYPERKVFMDGRAHYPPEFFLEHSIVNQSPEKAKEVLDKYEIDYVIILHPEGGEVTLADFLSDDKQNWALIYWDQYYLVYVRRKQEFYGVYSKFEYSYADPNLLRRPEKLEELSKPGKKALKPKVRTRGELERNLEINADNNRARVLLGGVLELIPDYDEALKVYDELLEREPKFPLAHYLRGNLLLQKSKQPSTAPSLFGGDDEPVPTPDPGNTLTLSDGTTVQKLLWEEAKQEFATAYQLDKKVPESLTVLAGMHQDEGNLDEAEKLWLKVTLIDSLDPISLYHLGILYSNEKFNADKARYYLERYMLLTSGETAERQRAEVILERLRRE